MPQISLPKPRPQPEQPPTTSRSDLLDLNSATLQDAALAYVNAGWPVLPLKPKNKTPLTKNGLKDASTDTAQITKWWTRWPTANIGLRTGVAFDVLDLDGPEGLLALPNLAPGYHHTGPVSSTGKGYHLLFAVTGSGNHTKLCEVPIDFRGENGYIVAPPSVHPNGHSYTWARDGELPKCPAWLHLVIFPPKPEPLGIGRTPTIERALEEAPTCIELLAALVGGEMRKVKRGYQMRCPFHADDTPSLTCYLDTNTFRCFGCLAWGDALNILKWKATGDPRDVHVGG